MCILGTYRRREGELHQAIPSPKSNKKSVAFAIRFRVNIQYNARSGVKIIALEMQMGGGGGAGRTSHVHVASTFLSPDPTGPGTVPLSVASKVAWPEAAVWRPRFGFG